MKKLLFLLISSAVFAWSANYGDLGYGSTAYGASGYGSTDYTSTAYGATAYGSTGSEATGYGVNGYCAATDSAAKPKAKIAAKTAAPKATASTNQQATTTEPKDTSAAINPLADIPENSYKKYGFRLAMSLGYMTWDNHYALSPVGIDFDAAFLLRSGGNHFFVEYGIGVALMGMYYHQKRLSEFYYGGYSYHSGDEYESKQGWLQVALDPQFLLGVEVGKVIVRFGAYAGLVGGPYPKNAPNPDPYLSDETLAEYANNYHFGLAANFAFRLNEIMELSIAIKYDLSDFSNDYPGFSSIGMGLGMLF